eukprot:gene22821-54610_t
MGFCPTSEGRDLLLWGGPTAIAVTAAAGAALTAATAGDGAELHVGHNVRMTPPGGVEGDGPDHAPSATHTRSPTAAPAMTASPADGELKQGLLDDGAGAEGPDVTPHPCPLRAPRMPRLRTDSVCAAVADPRAEVCGAACGTVRVMAAATPPLLWAPLATPFLRAKVAADTPKLASSQRLFGVSAAAFLRALQGRLAGGDGPADDAHATAKFLSQINRVDGAGVAALLDGCGGGRDPRTGDRRSRVSARGTALTCSSLPRTRLRSYDHLVRLLGQADPERFGADVAARVRGALRDGAGDGDRDAGLM